MGLGQEEDKAFSSRLGGNSPGSLPVIQESHLVAIAGQASHLSQQPSLPWGRASE